MPDINQNIDFPRFLLDLDFYRRRHHRRRVNLLNSNESRRIWLQMMRLVPLEIKRIIKRVDPASGRDRGRDGFKSREKGGGRDRTKIIGVIRH